MNEKQLEEKLTTLDQLQSACTSCGLCSEACATFQLTGYEHESPRGRLHLAAQFLHGHIQPHSPALSTFDHCLGCQACEPLCPHQVSYRQVRQLVQEVRGHLMTSFIPSMGKSQYRKWVTLAYRISNTLWRRYGAKWLKIPSIDCQSSGCFAKRFNSPLKTQPILVVCCVQDLFQHDVIEQALAFMQRLDYPLAIDKKQPCCGAIFERLVHGGEETVCYSQEKQRAFSLQNRSLHSFLRWLPSRAYFLAQGCQSFVAQHSSQDQDLYAWIASLLEQQRLTLYFPHPREVYYQPYCRVNKREQDPIWCLLQQIAGLTVHKILHPLACCGGCGGETLLHPQEAQALARQKIASLPNHATLMITSPDCWGLFKRYQADKNLNVLYPIQLLASALIQKK